MKKAELELQNQLTETLQENLSGLSEKHEKKLQKTIASSVQKLSKTFSKSLSEERKATDKKHLKATRASVKNLVQELHEQLGKRFFGSAKQGRKQTAV